MRAIDVLNSMSENEAKQNKIPWNVKRCFKDLEVTIYPGQVSFGEDFVSLEEARDTLKFLVEELGGTVKWKK